MSPVSSDTHLLRTGWGRRGCKRLLVNEWSIVSSCKRRIPLLICQILFLPTYASQLGKEHPRHHRHVVFTRTWFSFTGEDLLLCLCVVVYLWNDCPPATHPRGCSSSAFSFTNVIIWWRRHNKLELRFLFTDMNGTTERVLRAPPPRWWIHHQGRVWLMYFCPWQLGLRKSWVTDLDRSDFPSYSRTNTCGLVY